MFHNHVSISIIKKKKKKNVYKKKKNKTFLLTKNFYHLPFRSFLSRWRVGSESDQNSLKRETKEIELIIEECVYHILREINISVWKFHFDMEKCLGYKAAVLFHKRPIERKITHAYRNSRWLSKRRTVTGSLSSLTLGPSPEIILAYLSFSEWISAGDETTSNHLFSHMQRITKFRIASIWRVKRD